MFIITTKRLFRLTHLLYIVAHLVNKNVVHLDPRLLLDLVTLALTKRMPPASEYDIQRLIVRVLLVLSVLGVEIIAVVRLYGTSAYGHIHARTAIHIVQFGAHGSDVQIAFERIIWVDAGSVHDLWLKELVLSRIRILTVIVLRLIVVAHYGGVTWCAASVPIVEVGLVIVVGLDFGRIQLLLNLVVV